jgi:hypothetical protein
LTIYILSNQNQRGYIEKVVFFDDWRRCTEIRDFFIEDNKLKQLENEKKVLETFFISCEEEEVK